MTKAALRSPRKRLPGYWNPPFVVSVTFFMFIVARYMQWGARKDIFETIRIEFLLGLALIASCAFLLSAQPLKIASLPDAKKVILGIVLLFFAMIIQIPFAADPGLAQLVFWDRVIKFAMLTFFIMVLVRSPSSMRFFITAFLLACFYVTQESARGAINGGLIWENQGIMRLHGAVPIYRHPNSLAGVAAGTIPFCVFLIPAVRNWWVKLLLFAPLVTATLCVMYSGSRTGYVGFLVFLFFWWSQSERKGRWLLVAAAASVVLVPVIPDQYVERFQSIGGQEAEGHSKEARMLIIEDAVTIFLQNPGGVGVASFPAVRRAKFGRSQDTHNLYLEVATNLGIQGLGVFFYLISAMLRACFTSMHTFTRYRRALTKAIKGVSKRDPQRKILEHAKRDSVYMEAIAKATAGFIIVRLTLGLFGMDLYEVYWWFAAGIAVALGEIARRMGFVLQKTLEQPAGP